MKKYSIARLNKVATVGTYKPVTNENTGDYTETFVPSFQIYYGSYSRNVEHELSLVGTTLEDTVTIAIRHDERINKNIVVRIGDVDYRITNIDFDDGVNCFDLVTLQKKVGRG